jgi:hypothetical protein
VTNLYDFMDSVLIRLKSTLRAGRSIMCRSSIRTRGAAARPRRKLKRWVKRCANDQLAEQRRSNERSTAERVNGSLKDNYGALWRARSGHDKVFCHLMFGILALAIEQRMRIVTQPSVTARTGCRRSRQDARLARSGPSRGHFPPKSSNRYRSVAAL